MSDDNIHQRLRAALEFASITPVRLSSSALSPEASREVVLFRVVTLLAGATRDRLRKIVDDPHRE